PIRGNPTQLHQVLLNLCVNARDAMPNGGQLRIETESVVLKDFDTRWHRESVTGQYVRIVVSDTGHGIPPSIMEKLFEPFFTTKELGSGTGLGLSTVLGIVKHHGGFLDVQSETDQGTSFFVYLPAAVSIAQLAPGSEQPPIPMGHGEQILLVEDEAPLLEITRLTLEGFNYRVMIATDGAEAVRLYQKHLGDIQLVLTDMMMPVLDGPGTIRALEKIDPSVKIISVSGLGSAARGKISPTVRVNASLSKPYTTSQLLNTIRNVLESQMADAA
ncbi:MAG TPA: ATP-binding protein, partial [Candidatus Limnocylindria bacterium]|nr:ATP-binding protein [Candidatus Limnocylindria bacterium]